jgi:demethylmenaquinone methyltransferase / 2-methoxy-6-polyprenyl-1,4-benzoquinol methylase
MANRFYDPGKERAAKVKELFTRIASRYDLINDLQSFGLHRRWKRRVVKLSGARPGLRALDVCCGTGDLALALAREGAEVVGVDFNQRMLEEAVKKSEIRNPKSEVKSQKSEAGGRRSEARSPKFEAQSPRAKVQSSPAVRFVQGDAERLPFSDNLFDIVTVGYGLRNLARWETGLSEMARVARPGGRLLVLDFGKPDNALWRGLYFGYLRLFVPLLGRIFCGDASAYAYILESLKHYPAQEGVAAEMRARGLANVSVVNLLGGVMSINYGERRGD